MNRRDVPPISVLVPAYNAQRFIAATLDSIVQQTFANFEAIIVDDGSTDATRQTALSFRDPRIRLIEADHGGIVQALNIGTDAASGQWIARIDADDLMEPTRLERQLAFVVANPEISAVASYYKIIDEAGRQCGVQESPLVDDRTLRDYLDSGSLPIFTGGTVLQKKSAVQAAGGYREAYRGSEDVDLFIRMIGRGDKIVVQPEYLTSVRYHSSSETARSTRRQFLLNRLILENHHRRQKRMTELSADEFLENHQSASGFRKIVTEAAIQSAILLRRRHMVKLRGRTATASLLLASAAVLDPAASVRKLRRVISGRARANAPPRELETKKPRQ